jgi:hypothetical protein
MVPPVLSISTFDMLNVATLSAVKLLVTLRNEISSAVVVKFVALTVFAYIVAVLKELATIVLIFIYPPKGASIFPVRISVEAVIEDVSNLVVEIKLEKVAVFAIRLERVRDPAGFVITVEPRRNEVRVGASIVV